MKRHPLLLLEMMVALVIMGGVMAMLFAGFYDAIKAKNSVKQEKERVLILQRLKLRFATLFKNVIDVKQISDHEYHIQYAGGIDPDPNFRSKIESSLKLNNKVLTLTSWPEQGDPKEESRREVISENVNTITIEFFDEKEGKFTSQYPKQKPSMMKVIINETELPLFL